MDLGDNLNRKPTDLNPESKAGGAVGAQQDAAAVTETSATATSHPGPKAGDANEGKTTAHPEIDLEGKVNSETSKTWRDDLPQTGFMGRLGLKLAKDRVMAYEEMIEQLLSANAKLAEDLKAASAALAESEKKLKQEEETHKTIEEETARQRKIIEGERNAATRNLEAAIKDIERLSQQLESQRARFEQLATAEPSDEKKIQIYRKLIRGFADNCPDDSSHVEIHNILKHFLGEIERCHSVKDVIEHLNDMMRNVSHVHAIAVERLGHADDLRADAQKQADELTRKVATLESSLKMAIDKANEIPALNERIAALTEDSVRLNEENAQLLNSDAGKIATERDGALAELSVAKTQIDERDGRIASLSSEIDEANRTIAGLQAQIARNAETHKTEVEGLRENHRTKAKELSDKITALTNEKTALEKKHKEEIKETEDRIAAEKNAAVLKEKEAAADALKSAEAAHASAVEDINRRHEEDTNALMRMHEEATTALENRHAEEKAALESAKSEADNARKEAEKTVAEETMDLLAAARQAIDDIAAAAAQEIFKACDSEYADVAEDNNAELRSKLKKLKTAVDSLEPASTPSAQRQALGALFEDVLSQKYNVINRIMQYFVFSNVPFLIDSARNTGLYFSRKNVKEMYECMVRLLALGGITPELPQLFADNLDDGNYQAEAAFNDVEAFCPGTVSDHLRQVERGSKKQSIVGATVIGYRKADGTHVPTKVII